MTKTTVATLKKTFDLFPQNKIFMWVGVIILVLPMIATIGQFFSVNYFQETIPVMLFYWPGSDFEISIPMFAWLFMGMVFISYLAGIGYLFNNRTLGKVIVLSVLAFTGAGLLRSILAGLTGWHESALPDLAGKADSVILAEWHNPIWEEIFFRGIPLLILLAYEKYLVKKRTTAGILMFCIIPSVISGIYHIPGHGIIRFFDTFFLGIFFSWLALEYTFFAPVVMHYVADAIMVFSLKQIPSIQPSEIEWLTQYGNSLGSFFWLLTMMLLMLIPVLVIYYYKRQRRLITV